MKLNDHIRIINSIRHLTKIYGYDQSKIKGYYKPNHSTVKVTTLSDATTTNENIVETDHEYQIFLDGKMIFYVNAANEVKSGDIEMKLYDLNNTELCIFKDFNEDLSDHMNVIKMIYEVSRNINDNIFCTQFEKLIENGK